VYLLFSLQKQLLVLGCIITAQCHVTAKQSSRYGKGIWVTRQRHRNSEGSLHTSDLSFTGNFMRQNTKALETDLLQSENTVQEKKDKLYWKQHENRIQDCTIPKLEHF
jgi:hypothetical protein